MSKHKGKKNPHIKTNTGRPGFFTKLFVLLIGICIGAYIVLAFSVPQQDKSVPVKKAEEDRVSLLFVGDIMPSRYVARAMQQNGYDFPFRELATTTREADITFGNLESPVLTGAPVPAGSMRFRTDPEFLPHLKDAGFDIVSLANNHLYDHGRRGLEETLKHLRDNGISSVGVGTTSVAFAPTYLERKGVRVAYIAQNDPTPVRPESCATERNPGTACFALKRLKSSVEEARKNADYVIFTMHAGDEYVSYPNRLQVTYARAAIDAGADIVIGHHPHVVQTREQYKDKWIYYSLGNFIFDQAWSRETTLGLIVKVEIGVDSKRELALSHNIIKIEDFAKPRFANQDDIIERYALLDLP